MEYETRTVRSVADAVELFFDKGWTDGMPIVPPTPAAVDSMLATGGLTGAECLGTLSQRQKEVYAWQAATCAVMAGCRPDYFPIVLATWDAMFDPRFNLHSTLSSTGGPAIAAVVSGPYGKAIDMNAGSNVFGPGNRANATIGRAVRLGAMTALGATPGTLDASSLGHAGKYTMHFAEDPPPEPWRPIREQLGFPTEATTVTVFQAEAPRQILQNMNPDPEGLIKTIAACMRDPAQHGTGRGTYYLIVLGPEHASVLVEAGWSQTRVRESLASLSRVSEEELAGAGVLLARPEGDQKREPGTGGSLSTAEAQDILVITAGGPGAGWSAAIPSWTIKPSACPVTRPVRLPDQPNYESSGSSEALDFL